ncbi:MAG: hypothetical protein Q4Q58_04080 [Thermoplasmata archaeon]|nr:hypothetical protein [Thermoplasmata archaeon]
MSVGKYPIAAFAVFLVALTIVMFADAESSVDPDYTGVVSDISESTNGYIFYITTYQEKMRCYSSQCPVDHGYYGITGSFSSDGSIFFVKTMRLLEG